MHAVPLQMVTTQEIIRSKVVDQAINPFICVAEDFMPYQGLECRYVTIPVHTEVAPEITRSKVVGQPINPFIGIAEDFVYFIGRYSDYFTVSTRSVATQAEQYLCGLMQSDKRNMERMAESELHIEFSMERTCNFESDWHGCGFAFWWRSGHLSDH